MAAPITKSYNSNACPIPAAAAQPNPITRVAISAMQSAGKEEHPKTEKAKSSLFDLYLKRLSPLLDTTIKIEDLRILPTEHLIPLLFARLLRTSVKDEVLNEKSKGFLLLFLYLWKINPQEFQSLVTSSFGRQEIEKHFSALTIQLREKNLKASDCKQYVHLICLLAGQDNPHLRKRHDPAVYEKIIPFLSEQVNYFHGLFLPICLEHVEKLEQFLDKHVNITRCDITVVKPNVSKTRMLGTKEEYYAQALRQINFYLKEKKAAEFRSVCKPLQPSSTILEEAITKSRRFRQLAYGFGNEIDRFFNLLVNEEKFMSALTFIIFSGDSKAFLFEQYFKPTVVASYNLFQNLCDKIGAEFVGSKSPLEVEVFKSVSLGTPEEQRKNLKAVFEILNHTGLIHYYKIINVPFNKKITKLIDDGTQQREQVLKHLLARCPNAQPFLKRLTNICEEAWDILIKDYQANLQKIYEVDPVLGGKISSNLFHTCDVFGAVLDWQTHRLFDMFEIYTLEVMSHSSDCTTDKPMDACVIETFAKLANMDLNAINDDFETAFKDFETCWEERFKESELKERNANNEHIKKGMQPVLAAKENTVTIVACIDFLAALNDSIDFCCSNRPQMEEDDQWLSMIDEEFTPSEQDRKELSAVSKQNPKSHKKKHKPKISVAKAADKPIAQPAKISLPYENPVVQLLAQHRHALRYAYGMTDYVVTFAEAAKSNPNPAEVALQQQIYSTDCLQWILELMDSCNDLNQKELLATYFLFWLHLATEQGLSKSYLEQHSLNHLTHRIMALSQSLGTSASKHMLAGNSMGTLCVRYPFSSQPITADTPLIFRHVRQPTQATLKAITDKMPEMMREFVATHAEADSKKIASGFSVTKPITNEALEKSASAEWSAFGNSMQSSLDIVDRFVARTTEVRKRKALRNAYFHLNNLRVLFDIVAGNPQVHTLYAIAHMMFISTQYFVENLGAYLSINAGKEIRTHNLFVYKQRCGLGAKLQGVNAMTFEGLNVKKGSEYPYRHFADLPPYCVSEMMHYLNGLYATSKMSTLKREGISLPNGTFASMLEVHKEFRAMIAEPLINLTKALVHDHL